jgi:hypothetical protein
LFFFSPLFRRQFSSMTTSPGATVKLPSTQSATRRTGAPMQFTHAGGHGGQAVFGFELAFGGSAQVAGDHDGGTGVQRHLDGGDAGADARVFGDLTGIVLRHVQVGADEHAFAFGLAVGNDV